MIQLVSVICFSGTVVFNFCWSANLSISDIILLAQAFPRFCIVPFMFGICGGGDAYC